MPTIQVLQDVQEEEGQKESGMSEGGRNVLVYNMNIETSMYVNGKCGSTSSKKEKAKRINV